MLISIILHLDLWTYYYSIYFENHLPFGLLSSFYLITSFIFLFFTSQISPFFFSSHSISQPHGLFQYYLSLVRRFQALYYLSHQLHLKDLTLQYFQKLICHLSWDFPFANHLFNFNYFSFIQAQYHFICKFLLKWVLSLSFQVSYSQLFDFGQLMESQELLLFQENVNFTSIHFQNQFKSNIRSSYRTSICYQSDKKSYISFILFILFNLLIELSQCLFGMIDEIYEFFSSDFQHQSK